MTSAEPDPRPSPPFRPTLVCPRDKGPLTSEVSGLQCARCGLVFPLVNGVPILINDANSVFAIADYIGKAGYEGASYGRDWAPGSGTTARKTFKQRFQRLFRRLADSPSSLRYISDAEAIATVRQSCPNPRILVVGSADRRHGDASDRVARIDVALGPGVDIVADAHDLPFPEQSFDLVIAIAVLEHVADPPRCVEEFCRVLRPDGFVYAITPFLQPVHMGAYDFTRYTPLGHRRLFRRFDTIAAGPALGVGTVAAWTLSSFLQSIPAGRRGRQVLGAAGLLCQPILRKLDRWLSAPPHIDAAGGNYFFGRQRAEPIPDRILIHDYRGGFPPPG